MNFWDFVWLEDGIRNAAKSCADVESEGERTLIAAVRFPCVGGDGHQGRRPKCVTEGKGEEREEIESKMGVKSECIIHTTRQIIPFPGLICGQGSGPRAAGNGIGCCLLPRTDGVHIFPLFFHITLLPAYSFLLITVRPTRLSLPLQRYDASQS